jgi:glyoxylase-like metal-dependent hydrolase (beta-lactamase superfamily II)
MKKRMIFIAVLLFYLTSLTAQNEVIQITNELKLVKLSPYTYIHTSHRNNGLVIIDQSEAAIVSTPMSDELTDSLISWIQQKHKAIIKAYVIDMWHPDAMEGLDVVHNHDIASYACHLTGEIAREKSLPVPKNTFQDSIVIQIGKRRLIARYFGPGHTKDGIVVWIPDQKILFGSNSVRNMNGWYGNIADADIKKWSSTIEKVKASYGHASIVVPGHGKHGGPELLDYTIDLYRPSKWGKLLKKYNVKPAKIFRPDENILVIAKEDSVLKNKTLLTDAIIFVDKTNQYLMVESPSIELEKDKTQLRSPYGRLKIINKETNSNEDDIEGYYQQLIIQIRDDPVGMVVILKNFIR